MAWKGEADSDCLKVKPAAKVHGGNDDLKSGNDTLNNCDVLLRGSGVDGTCVVGATACSSGTFGRQPQTGKKY